MIISDITMRKIVCDDIEEVQHITQRALKDDKLVDIDLKKGLYEIKLISKVGDNFRKEDNVVSVNMKITNELCVDKIMDHLRDKIEKTTL